MSWTRDEVFTAVRSVILEHAEVSEATGETELVGDLGIDSLGVMEVVAELEDRFEMTIADAQLRDVATMGDVVKAIESRLKEEGRLSS